ncbi:MAG: FHA domain-containing protein, partial [Candidatus Brocadiae bacterium]|nr:FHA domain-containing protein [Candidatus Brocadiia bacterium]
LDGKVIGVVLNDVRPRTLRYYGSYGYYYYDYRRYYKHYGDDEPDTLKLVIPTATAAKPEATAAVAEQELEPTADDDDAPRAVSFSMRSGDERSLSFGLKDGEEVVLGRDAAECNFTLPDAAISRVHCRIANIGGNILVEDLGTANGTYVNDERVQKAEVSLGDVIRIGRYEISVGGSPSGHGA